MAEIAQRDAGALHESLACALRPVADWGILTTDRELRITTWSGWLETASGRSAAELVGRDLFEAFPELAERKLDGLFRQALEGQATSLPHRRHQYLLRMPSGDARFEILPQSARIAPLVESGFITGALAIIEDETERLAADLAANDLRNNEFLAMLAHELRNPLAPILCGVELLRMTHPEDEESRMAIEIIERQTHQLTRLVDDLLDVARVTHRTIKLRMEPVEMAAVIAKAVETCRPLIDARRHTLRVELETGPMTVEADAIRLAQVIANLLDNAAKYTPEGGCVTLAARRDGSAVVTAVRDNGIGICPAMLPKVFDLFTQGDSSLDRSQGGLGIGLSIARSLVELHGGELVGRSAGRGAGSEFEIRLPLLAGHDGGAAPRGAETPPRDGLRRRRVLVVDDNVDGARLLGMLLETLGHSVQLAFDGPGALQRADAWRPEVVLLDIGLPDIDGFEVARRMRQSPSLSGASLVAITGYGGGDDRMRSREAGFDHHLVKPVMLESLRRFFDGLSV